MNVRRVALVVALLSPLVVLSCVFVARPAGAQEGDPGETTTTEATTTTVESTTTTELPAPPEDAPVDPGYTVGNCAELGATLAAMNEGEPPPDPFPAGQAAAYGATLEPGSEPTAQASNCLLAFGLQLVATTQHRVDLHQAQRNTELIEAVHGMSVPAPSGDGGGSDRLTVSVGFGLVVLLLSVHVFASWRHR